MGADLEGTECVMCERGKYEEVYKTEIFLNKYLVEDAHLYECDTCGSDVIPEDEQDRVMEKVKKLENSTLYRLINRIKSWLFLPSKIQIL